ncbi:MAG TPA: amino acid permease [Arthrobacter sp.]|nr:amino acid permease [Arthrobacter sp.]
MNLFRTKSIEQSMSDADEPGRQLKRSLSSWDLMIMGVAVAVGAGIFSVGAKAAANFAGPAVTLSFAIAAVTCALAIMCYAEFATAIPVAGSAYVFTYATMGELLAWIIGWNLILELFTAGAVIAKYWGIYLSKVFALMGVDIPPSISLGGVVDLYWGAFLIVAVFTVLLVLGTKLSARVGNIFTLIKIGVVLFVIVVGFSYVKFENYAPFVPTSEPTGGTGAADVMKQSFFGFLTGAAPAQYGTLGIFAGAALVFFAFIGFDVVATSAEEVKNPQKTLPRGIFGGLAVVTVLYILVSLALTGMVSYTELAKADNPTLTTAFEAVGNTDAAKIIAFGSLIGLTTVIMVLLMGLSRVVLAMSRDGLLPRALSKTSTIRATPVRLQIICGAAVAVVAGLTNVDLLEEMINIGTLSAFVTVSIGVLVLRKKRPDLKPAFQVPFGKVLPIVSAVLCLYLMTNLAVETWIFFAIWLLIGIVIYFSYGQRHSRLNEKFAEARASVNGPAAAPARVAGAHAAKSRAGAEAPVGRAAEDPEPDATLTHP